ncbi:hypothetical protein [Larkinella sp.]|uniref:hypothetical protein n=1 Tax=Larkinella sp. TaxID=2034517 RepID=UPI003BAA87F2
MKALYHLLFCFGLLTGLTTCKDRDNDSDSAEPLAVIATAIPNGLIPGSALTLKGRNFLTVTSVKLANTTIPASDFIRTAPDELSFKVPMGTTAGKICVVNQNGQGEWKDMALITSGVLTADNVGVNVGSLVQGYYSDACSPQWFMYCLNGACLVYRRQTRAVPVGAPAGATCEKYYSVEQISGSSYEVYPNDKVTLKFELKKNSQEYTGMVIMIMNGTTYLGNMVKKNSGGSLIGYSVIDGQTLKLCNPYPNPPAGFYGQPAQLCAEFKPCTNCQ